MIRVAIRTNPYISSNKQKSYAPRQLVQIRCRTAVDGGVCPLGEKGCGPSLLVRGGANDCGRADGGLLGGC